ncbi:putative pterin-4-alpha-carbinolamine dehydratase [Allorhodopirellula heiligendammensis]|uniref:4a-hydroxytetrahydrobiopterin dehydratase n=2 Tax=Allorhodopirellula heiligendammensis TaxID=2714739 RepID=A0A5C6BYU1_9BACT|nr:putative pterin-4-alpha-carbinolamine dehydratase [Allorhodopirellula heiligendammensis]
METAREYLVALSSWQLDESSGSISRQIQGGSFVQVIDIVNRIAVLAEDQQHHPDLHVTGYRHLKVVLTTHAIGGLSENDFIVAAKIDELLAA